jgi:iron complex transport system permease protein
MFQQKNKLFLLILFFSLLSTMILSIAFGAVSIKPIEMYQAIIHFLKGEKIASIYEGVFLQLRLPRVLLCGITGAILAVSGVLMQGLFRNPIVEPGLAGTSAGAAFGASIVFVLSSALSPEMKGFVGPFLVPLFAFAGGMLATFTVYGLAKDGKNMPIVSLLLVGMAINAVGISGTGFMSYLARDPQARSITFWNLGTFSGTSWTQVFIVTITGCFVFLFSFRYAKHLNALLLGEEEATYLGVETLKTKRNLLILNTLMVSVATAFVGVISFIGLIVPHILRSLIGSDNKLILPAAAFSGAILLLIADFGARLLLAPAEIPIGIITSLVGAPIFIFLLKKNILIGKIESNA